MEAQDDADEVQEGDQEEGREEKGPRREAPDRLAGETPDEQKKGSGPCTSRAIYPFAPPTI